MKNKMASTSTSTLAKGDGKVKIIKRGVGSSIWGWRAHSQGGGQRIHNRSKGDGWNQRDRRRDNQREEISNDY